MDIIIMGLLIVVIIVVFYVYRTLTKRLKNISRDLQNADNLNQHVDSLHQHVDALHKTMHAVHGGIHQSVNQLFANRVVLSANNFDENTLPEQLYVFALPHIKNKTVLDLNADTGYGCNFMFKYGFVKSIVGFDNDEAIIKYANDNYANQQVQFRAGAIHQLPFSSGQFDVILYKYEHSDPYELSLSLQSLSNILKPDNLLIVISDNQQKKRQLIIDSGYEIQGEYAQYSEYDNDKVEVLSENNKNDPEIKVIYVLKNNNTNKNTISDENIHNIYQLNQQYLKNNDLLLINPNGLRSLETLQNMNLCKQISVQTNNPEQVNIFRSNNQNINVKDSITGKITHADQQFNTLISLQEHADMEHISECQRVLKDDGCLILNITDNFAKTVQELSKEFSIIDIYAHDTQNQTVVYLAEFSETIMKPEYNLLTITARKQNQGG